MTDRGLGFQGPKSEGLTATARAMAVARQALGLGL